VLINNIVKQGIKRTMGRDDDHLSQLFAALANPTRRAILERLAEGDATVNELAEPFDMSLPAVSRHISVLEETGLINQGQNAQYRPCSLDARPLREVAEWTEQYRKNWEEAFDRLDEYLRKIQKEEA
jgi:DNA-binding transcriptional ArsR family regulator